MSAALLMLQVFCTFFIIGMFTFGGGYAIMSLIQARVVFDHGWISEGTFTDIVAISQMTPGPIGLNCSTYVGYEVMLAGGYGEALGTIGSFTASLAIVLPSFLIVLAIAHFYAKFHTGKVFQGTMAALKPAVVGLIGAAAVVMIAHINLGCDMSGISIVEENFPDWKSWALFTAAFVASLKFKLDPIGILLGGGLIGLLIY